MQKRKEKNIDRYDLKYAILYKYIKFALTKVFYRKFTVIHKEPLPENIPLVFASNHQNALIDALIIICAAKRQIVFFARADIFSKKIMRKILFFLKIAPLFRIRDGRESLQFNNESFTLATNILSRKNSVGIFPEGTHNDKEQILPLKKGLARMVLQAENTHNFELNINVIPVSIAYLDYIKPRSEVRIFFGQPLTFSHLKEIYEKNPSQALNKFNDEFESALKSIVINIESTEYYELIQKMRKTVITELYGKKTNLSDSFNLSFEFISKINLMLRVSPQQMDKLLDLAGNYYSLIEINKINESVFYNKKLPVFLYLIFFFVLLISFPVFIAGYIINYLPFLFMYNYVNKKIKDPQFRSSVYFSSTALFVAPFFYFLQAITTGLLFSSLFSALISIPAMLFLGITAYQYYRFFIFVKQEYREYYFMKRNSDKLKHISKLRNELINTIFELNLIKV